MQPYVSLQGGGGLGFTFLNYLEISIFGDGA